MASFYSEEELKEIGFKQFGKNVLISKKASIYGAGDISLGSNVRVDDFCVLSGKIDIGSYVHISVYAGLFGGDAGIVIGDFCAVSSKVMVYAVNDDYTGIGLTNPMVPMEYRNVTEEQVILNDHCIVGSGCTVLPGVILEGIFSHFANADSADKSFTVQQLQKFQAAIDEIEKYKVKIPIKHIAESAAILEIPEAHFDMVRAGIITYGLMPSNEVHRTIDLQTAFRLCAKIAWIKQISAGTSIGYGRDFVALRDSTIATLPIGYADGFLRAYARDGFVEVNGYQAPIAGRVCMDQTMIDVTDVPDVKVGDEVTLFGSNTLTIDDIAKRVGTINYEIPCLISERVPRLYI